MNIDYLHLTLNNVFTILFAMHPYFIYQVCQLNKINKSSNKNLKINIIWIVLSFTALLVVPPLWLLVNNELANFLLVLFVLGVYYFINANLNNPE